MRAAIQCRTWLDEIGATVVWAGRMIEGEDVIEGVFKEMVSVCQSLERMWVPDDLM